MNSGQGDCPIGNIHIRLFLYKWFEHLSMRWFLLDVEHMLWKKKHWLRLISCFTCAFSAYPVVGIFLYCGTRDKHRKFQPLHILLLQNYLFGRDVINFWLDLIANVFYPISIRAYEWINAHICLHALPTFFHAWFYLYKFLSSRLCHTPYMIFFQTFFIPFVVRIMT